ncbi:MAG: hypothetical protein MJ105_06665 [Lachnospiraceae bacterium]|nr:hypothetical protein [Lachnospiraceae bacterium]
MDEKKQELAEKTKKGEKIVRIYIPKTCVAIALGVVVIGMVLLFIYLKQKGFWASEFELFGAKGN